MTIDANKQRQLLSVLACVATTTDEEHAWLSTFLQRLGITVNLPLTIMAVGQSNGAAGPPVPYGHSFLVPLLGTDLRGFSGYTEAWAQLVDGTCNPKANPGGTGTGQGPGGGQVLTRLMRSIAAAKGQTVYLQGFASTGKALAHFLPDSSEKAVFEDLSTHPTLNNFQYCQFMASSTGRVPEVYILIQGEADTGSTKATHLAKLVTLFDAVEDAYPGVRPLIVGTIGDKNMRIDGFSCVGVFEAQQQICVDRGYLFLDNRDMSLSSAYYGFGADMGRHYTTAIGFETVADRLFALLQDRDFDLVEPGIDHIDDVVKTADGVVLPWGHRWQYNRAVDGNGKVTALNDMIGTSHLGVSTAGGTHVQALATAGNRSAVDLNPASSEGYTVAGMSGGANWSAFGIFELDTITNPIAGFEIRDAGAANRFALRLSGQANIVALVYDTTEHTFAGPAAPTQDTFVHTYGLTIDTPNLVAKLFVDGSFFGSVAIDGSESEDPATMFLGSLSGTERMDGRFLELSLRLGVMTPAQMAAGHTWAQTEYRLKT